MKLPFTLGRLLFGGFFLYNGINHFLHYKTLSQYARASPAKEPRHLAVPFGRRALATCEVCSIPRIQLCIRFANGNSV